MYFLQFRLFNVWNDIRDDPNKVFGILWNAQTEVIHLYWLTLLFYSGVFIQKGFGWFSTDIGRVQSLSAVFCCGQNSDQYDDISITELPPIMGKQIQSIK